MNQKKAKTIRKIAYHLSKGKDYLPEMKVKKDAVRKEIIGEGGKKETKVIRNAKFQRVLAKMGTRSITRSLKKLYLQKKIKIAIDRTKL